MSNNGNETLLWAVKNGDLDAMKVVAGKVAELENKPILWARGLLLYSVATWSIAVATQCQ